MNVTPEWELKVEESVVGVVVNIDRIYISVKAKGGRETAILKMMKRMWRIPLKKDRI